MRQSLTGIRLALVLVTCLVGRAASAQSSANVTLTVSSAGTPFPLPSAADFQAGYIDNPVPLAFNGNLKGPANGNSYTSYVEVCALASTVGGGKSVADLLWRPSDLSAPFQPLVLNCDGPVSASRLAGSYTLAKNTLQRNFSGSILLRLVLRWTDTATSYGVPLGFTTSMTQP